ANLYHAPIAHDVANHVSPNPPDSVGWEPNAAIRVEVFDRFHETHVALLNQIQEVFECLLIFSRNHHHQTKISGDQLVGSFEVAVLFVVHGKLVLFFAAQKRESSNFSKVTLQRVERNKSFAARVGIIADDTLG